MLFSPNALLMIWKDPDMCVSSGNAMDARELLLIPLMMPSIVTLPATLVRQPAVIDVSVVDVMLMLLAEVQLASFVMAVTLPHEIAEIWMSYYSI